MHDPPHLPCYLRAYSVLKCSAGQVEGVRLPYLIDPSLEQPPFWQGLEP